VNGVWKVIQAICIVETNTWCGTHVHVSPSVHSPQQAPFNLDQAKSVARAVLYFEAATDALVPPDRLKSQFCKSFHAANTNFKGKSMEQCFALVEKSKSDQELVELMNNPDRCFAWNFQNLWNARGTIEFRQGPGVTSSDDTLAWAEFAVTFVGAALKAAGSYKDLTKYTINVGGLKVFLKHGVVSGVSDPKVLARVTGRAKDSAKIDGTQPAPLDKDQKKRYERKVKDEQKKDIFPKKLEKERKARLAAEAADGGNDAGVKILEEGK
jgi:hypothetical protein